MTDVSVSLPAKRKRGRPRKDGNILSREGSFKSPSHMKTQRIELTSPIKRININSPNGGSVNVDGMVGSMIHGVIEGSFDAGYLISVRIGNNGTPFRGVVFQPGKIVPITAANDVAPQARMFQRKEIPVPINYDDPNQVRGFSPRPKQVILQPIPKQAVFRPVVPQSSPPYNNSTFMRSSSYPNMGGNTIPRSPTVGANQHSPPGQPTGNLRMVEQDEVMQAFEVSSSSPNGSNNNNGKTMESGLGPNMANQNKQNSSNLQLHHNFMEDMTQSAFGVQQDEMICHDFHQDFFSGQSHQPNTLPKSPNLTLDLASAVHEKRNELSSLETNNYMVLNQLKNPNQGYHQALVAGNPLLLPPDIMGEPLEVESGVAGNSERFHGDGMSNAEAANSQYKLGLAATPQSSQNRMPTDMDFVLSDVVQHTESNVISDNQHR